jgi:hypothetical protein
MSGAASREELHFSFPGWHPWRTAELFVLNLNFPVPSDLEPIHIWMACDQLLNRIPQSYMWSPHAPWIPVRRASKRIETGARTMHLLIWRLFLIIVGIDAVWHQLSELRFMRQIKTYEDIHRSLGQSLEGGGKDFLGSDVFWFRSTGMFTFRMIWFELFAEGCAPDLGALAGLTTVANQ